MPANLAAQDCTIAAIHAKIYQFATHRPSHCTGVANPPLGNPRLAF
jgi:hypothetical protein